MTSWNFKFDFANQSVARGCSGIQLALQFLLKRVKDDLLNETELYSYK